MAEKRITKMVRWNLRCDKCGYVGITHHLGEYGRLIGYTSCYEFAEFNAFEDPVFDEVKALVEECLPKDNPMSSLCFRQVLEIVCDSSPSGEKYKFDEKFVCPSCRNPQLKFGPDDPPVIEEVNLPFVTHKIWQDLKKLEKLEKMEKKLKSIDCIS